MLGFMAVLVTAGLFPTTSKTIKAADAEPEEEDLEWADSAEAEWAPSSAALHSTHTEADDAPGEATDL